VNDWCWQVYRIKRNPPAVEHAIWQYTLSISLACLRAQGATTIAIRYAAQRQQFGPPDGSEIAVLDYQSLQWCALHSHARSMQMCSCLRVQPIQRSSVPAQGWPVTRMTSRRALQTSACGQPPAFGLPACSHSIDSAYLVPAGG